MNDLISIIVPVYNLAGLLPNSIGSILRQTYQNLEIIAVDDGSSDVSLSVLKAMEAKEARLHVIHQDNQGVTCARLAGIAAAKGDWIGFVDGDDEIEPDMYERLLKNALHFDAEISHCGFQMVFPSRTDYYSNTGKLLVEDRREALLGLLGGSYEPGLCNKLFHRSLLDRFLQENRMVRSIRINEDLLMNYYLFQESKRSVFEDFCPYHYLVRVESAANTPTNSNVYSDPIKVKRILAEETKDDPELYAASFSGLVETLIRISTKRKQMGQEEINRCIEDARAELRQLWPQLRNEPRCPKQMKIKAWWAMVSPSSYHLARSFYGELTGKKHKYDVK